ncbi:MAG: CoxG family protein [Alphaproteobacteria bacterium]
MELKGRYGLQATRETIWAALRDPDVITKCLPGCESVEKISDDEMKLVVAVSVGPFEARLTGTVRQSELDPPTRWALIGEVRGRPSGRAGGSVTVELTEAGNGTELSFVGLAEPQGKLADIDDSVVEDFAKELADTFFARLDDETAPNDARKEWIDQLDHSPAAVLLGDEPTEDVVVDKAESAARAAEQVEVEIESAASRGSFGGPAVWGLLAVASLIVILAVLY